jgi:SnoaL-like domain
MNGVNEQQVPNLEEMDEQQAQQFLTDLYTVLSAEKEYELRHEDYVMEMPQSGERIRGRENMRRFQEALASNLPNPPSIRIDRVRVRDGVWVKEGINDYGDGVVFNSVVIYELKDGKIWRDTRYYAEPLEAPEWRAAWVERMETGAPPR